MCFMLINLISLYENRQVKISLLNLIYNLLGLEPHLTIDRFQS